MNFLLHTGLLKKNFLNPFGPVRPHGPGFSGPARPGPRAARPVAISKYNTSMHVIEIHCAVWPRRDGLVAAPVFNSKSIQLERRRAAPMHCISVESIARTQLLHWAESGKRRTHMKWMGAAGRQLGASRIRGGPSATGSASTGRWGWVRGAP